MCRGMISTEISSSPTFSMTNENSRLPLAALPMRTLGRGPSRPGPCVGVAANGVACGRARAGIANANSANTRATSSCPSRMHSAAAASSSHSEASSSCCPGLTLSLTKALKAAMRSSRACRRCLSLLLRSSSVWAADLISWASASRARLRMPRVVLRACASRSATSRSRFRSIRSRSMSSAVSGAPRRSKYVG